MSWLSAFVTSYPRLIVILVALITAALATELRDLRPEVDLADLIPSDHPYVRIDQEINERFGMGLTAIVAIGGSKGVFETEVLEKIARITSAIERTDGVVASSIMSLSSENIRAIAREGEEIYVGPLMREIPRSPEQVAALKASVRSNPVASRYLVTPDFSGAMILADFASSADSEGVAQSLEAIAEAERRDGTTVLVGGQPTALAALDTATRGIVPLLCLSLVLVGLVHLEAFRSLQGTFLPLVTAAVSVVWSIGLARLLGFRVTPWTALTTILVLSVAAGHAVQMLKRYYECLEELGDNKRAVVESLNRVGPVMITAGAVAAAGFGSLAGFGVPAVQDFGVIASCGIVSALIVEVTLIPAIRTLLRPDDVERAPSKRSHRLLERVAGFTTRLVVSRPRHVVAAVVIAVAVASLGIFSLRVDTAFRSWFDADNRAIVADREIRERFIGTSTIRLLVESNEPGGLTAPEALAGITAIQNVLDSDSGVSASLSVADFIRAAHRAVNGDVTDALTLPSDRELISQYLLILESESMSRLITADSQSAVIYALARTDSVEWAQALFERLSEEADRALPPNVTLRLAGGELAQAIANNDTVVREKLKNMVQVAAVIFLLSSLVFRSLVGGLLVLAPLICAAVVNLGVMGWVGSPLSFATATYTSMGVSLGADFAIYLLFRIREEIVHSSPEKAVSESLRTAGQAVVFVASAIAAGYATLMLSGFALWRELGAYVGLMMLVSAFCTTTLLPALVLLARPRFLASEEGP